VKTTHTVTVFHSFLLVWFILQRCMWTAVTVGWLKWNIGGKVNWQGEYTGVLAVRPVPMPVCLPQIQQITLVRLRGEKRSELLHGLSCICQCNYPSETIGRGKPSKEQRLKRRDVTRSRLSVCVYKLIGVINADLTATLRTHN